MLRPVDQPEIEVVTVEAAEAHLEGLRRLVPGKGGQLGGDEDLLAGKAALAKGAPHRGLVLVDRRGVEVAVADVEGAADSVVGGFPLHLPGAETDDRHPPALRERDGLATSLGSHPGIPPDARSSAPDMYRGIRGHGPRQDRGAELVTARGRHAVAMRATPAEGEPRRRSSPARSPSGMGTARAPRPHRPGDVRPSQGSVGSAVPQAGRSAATSGAVTPWLRYSIAWRWSRSRAIESIGSLRAGSRIRPSGSSPRSTRSMFSSSICR